jgi:hypothetical protein
MSNQLIDELYCRARERGQKGLFRSFFSRHSSCLFTLQEIEDNCAVHAHHDAGTRTVPIRQIRGSENRCGDFDRDFNPLHDQNKGRWLSIAGARQRGKALPPVDLVEVGDVFFVRDGHHRISVARELGQQTIEAKVMIWQVTGPLPWEKSTRTIDRRRPGQEARRFHARLRDDGHALVTIFANRLTLWSRQGHA